MSERDRPISYEKARTLLFQHLASNIGITVTVSSLDWHDGPVLFNSHEVTDDKLGPLWAEARQMLDQLIFSWTLPCWVQDQNGRWTHADHDTIVARLTSGEEPMGLFVDRMEFEENVGLQATKKRAPVGRPPNSGFAKLDERAVDDMRPLVQGGLSVTAAAREVLSTHKLPGASVEAIIRRIRDRYIAKYGHGE